jgi:hypothetical protein
MTDYSTCMATWLFALEIASARVQDETFGPPKDFPLDRRMKSGIRHCLLTSGAPTFDFRMHLAFYLSNLQP